MNVTRGITLGLFVGLLTLCVADQTAQAQRRGGRARHYSGRYQHVPSYNHRHQVYRYRNQSPYRYDNNHQRGYYYPRQYGYGYYGTPRFNYRNYGWYGGAVQAGPLRFYWR